MYYTAASGVYRQTVLVSFHTADYNYMEAIPCHIYNYQTTMSNNKNSIGELTNN